MLLCLFIANMMSNAGKYDELLHNGKNMILYLQLRLLIKEGYKIMKLKNFLIGLLMLAGVVVMFVAMPKQANAAADGNAVKQYATTVVGESNVQLGKYVVESSESANSPFVNFIGFDSEPLWQVYKKSIRKHHRNHHGN